MSSSWRKKLNEFIKRKEEALKNNKTKVVAEMSESIGFLLFENGFMDEAADQFLEKAEIHKNEHNRMELAKTYHVITDIFCDSGDLERALEYCQNYYNISTEEGSLIELQRATATLGRIFYLLASEKNSKHRQRYLNKSLHFYNKSQTFLDTVSSQLLKSERLESRACLYLNMGILHEEIKKHSEAIDFFRKSADLSQLCNSNETELKALLGLANLSLGNSKYGDCSSYLDECLRCIKKCKSNTLTTEVYIIMAKLKLKEADFGTSLKYFKYCYQNIHLTSELVEDEFNLLLKLAIKGYITLQQTSSVVDANIKALLYKKLGKILFKCKSYRNSLKYFSMELEITKKCQDHNIGPILMCIGECNYMLLEYNESITAFNQSLVYLTSEQIDIGYVYYRIGCCQEFLKFSSDTIKRSFDQALIYTTDIQFRKLIISKLENFDTQGKVEDELNAAHYQSLIDYEVSDIDVMEELEKVSDISLAEQKPVSKMRKPATLSYNPNKRNDVGETLLHVACIKGHTTNVFELIEKGADVNSRDNCGWLPLHEACNHGHLDIVEILLNNGAHINDIGGVECNGITPLIDAADNNHFKIVKLLLDRGADASLCDNDNRSLMSILVEKLNHVDDDTCIELKEIIKIIQSKNVRYRTNIIQKPIKETQVCKNKKLEALADDRVPLLVAASESPHKPKLNRKVTDNHEIFDKKSDSIVTVGHARKRKAVLLSSDDDEIKVPELPPKISLSITMQVQDALASHEISPFIEITVTNGDSFNFRKSYLKDSKVFDIYNDLNSKCQNIYNYMLLDSLGIILLPFMELSEINWKMPLKLVTLSSEDTLLNICKSVDLRCHNNHVKRFDCSKRMCLSLFNLSISSFTHALFFTMLFKQITHLDFSFSNFMNENLIEYLSKILPYFSHLIQLNMSNSNLTASKLKIFSGFECKLKHILELNLSYNSIGTDALALDEALYCLLKESKFECLKLSYCNIEEFFDPTHSFTQLFQESKTTYLDLAGNNLTDKCMGNLCSNLPWNTFSCLNFSGMSYIDLQDLSCYLKKSNKSIRLLDISGNCINDSLCILLESPTFLKTIVELNISDIQLDHHSFSYLLDALCKFTQLKTLYLYDNPIFSSLEQLFQSLVQMLEAKSLTYLDLSNTVYEASTSQVSLSPSIFPSCSIYNSPSKSFISKIVLNNNNLSYEGMDYLCKKFNLSKYYKYCINRCFCSLELL